MATMMIAITSSTASTAGSTICISMSVSPVSSPLLELVTSVKNYTVW